MPLKEISIGWQWLERTLNAIIAEVNLNKPLGSTSIALEQHPNGTLLKAITQNNQDSQKSGGQQAAPVWHDVGWQTVTVVDPVSCAQSQIQVLVQQKGSSITIQ